MTLPHSTATLSSAASTASAEASALPPPPPATPGSEGLAPAAPAPAHPALAADLIFATFWCAPGIAPTDYASRLPDLRFADAIRKAHAGKRVHVAVLTDNETTVLEGGGDEGGDGASPPTPVEVFRCASLERARVGRNSYANWAQMVAQGAYLAHLERLAGGEGGVGGAGGGPPPHHPPVVFCDTDLLFVGDISEAFAPGPPGMAEAVLAPSRHAATTAASPPSKPSSPPLPSTPFDYGLTISDAVDMPVNFGIQFVPAGGAGRARAFLAGVCSVYDFSKTFVAGQEAIGAFTGLIDDAPLNQAVRRVAYGPAGRGLVAAADGSRVAFFPCLKFNYCRCGQSCCTDPGRTDGEVGDHAHAPADAAGFAAVPVKVFHAVGHRKPGFDVAQAAFLLGGAGAAYAAIAALPDEEADYGARFGSDAVAGGRAAAVEAAVEAALAEAAKAGEVVVAADETDSVDGPATAPASRDPSPPRKKAVVEVVESGGVAVW